MLLEPGSVAFVISSDYVYGGYPVVVIEEDTSRENCFIVRKKIGLIWYNQVVSRDILRELSFDEVEKYKEDLDFLNMLLQKECGLK
jgi:hypothetical protein